MLFNAMRVLDLFTTSRPEIGVLEAAGLLGKPKSTTSRWLSGMEEAGFLDRSGETGRYRVSLKIARLGQLAQQSTSLQRTAYPTLQRITAETGETSNLVLLVGSEGTNVDAVSSPRPVAHLGAVGKRFPVYASAAGKSLIAWLGEEEILAMLPSPLERFTATTITDVGGVMEELEKVRRQGWALNWREYEEELVGIGAPVRDHRGEVIAAVSISAPASRVTRSQVPELGSVVARAAAALSQALGHREARPGSGAVAG